MDKNHLPDVLHVPEIKANLISIKACLDKRIKIISDKNYVQIYKNGKILAVGAHENKLFTMKFKPILPQQFLQQTQQKKKKMIH